MVWIDDATWAAIQASVPIVCADLIPMRRVADRLEVGLIHRAAPFDDQPRWCQLGGRVRHGETVRAALLRHLHETLHGVSVELPADPQPDYVMQWFPDLAPLDGDGATYGLDPRQHAVSLCYRVELIGEPTAVDGGEGHEFRWFDAATIADELADTAWPGTLHMVRQLLP